MLNEGPSLLMVVGDHLGGEFECQWMQPEKFDGEVALIDGGQWHRNHAAWEGDRISFVAFTNSMQAEASEEEFEKLDHLGFRRPSPEYLSQWKWQVECDPGHHFGGGTCMRVRRGAHRSSCEFAE